MQFAVSGKEIPLAVLVFLCSACPAFGAPAAANGAQVTLAAPAAPAAAPATVATAPFRVAQVLDKNQLKQRLDFSDMTINQSDAAKRIMASSNAEAKAKHKEAQEKLAAAVSAFNAGDLALAKSKADEASKLMGEAMRLVPSEYMVTKAKARYADLLTGIEGLEASYAQNYAVISKEPGGKHLQPLDSAKIRKAMDTARVLYSEAKYDKANEVLAATLSDVSVALNKMLANRTMSYEMKFDSPDQEYLYELARFHHFEELIPLALEQKQPTKDLQAQMDAYIAKARMKRDQAAAAARHKNFAAAIDKIKDAADDIESGLKLIGVR